MILQGMGSFAHSLYTCIKHYINDCAVVTISRYWSWMNNNLLNAKIYSAEKFQIGHVAAQRSRLKHERAHILTDHVTHSISYPRNSLLVLQLRSQELPREDA